MENNEDNRQMTVLAEALKEVRACISSGESKIGKSAVAELEHIEAFLESLLPKEKEVLIKTKENELLHFCNPDAAKQMAEDWFNETFKQG